MGFVARNGLLIFLLCAGAAAQLPSSQCDTANRILAGCPFHAFGLAAPSGGVAEAALDSSSDNVSHPSPDATAFLSAPKPSQTGKFHWGRALLESFMFLSIEQAYVVHDDYHWVTVENGVPFNHFWRDYTYSLNTWIHSGWNDGDPLMYGYLGHPIQGAMTEYIQIQNDPRGRDLELANTKEYWHSRFRAFLWNAVYSTQWNIGPLSELTVEKYGSQVRTPWNQNGTWPCTHHPCLTGAGQIDLVLTPIGGTGWLLGEDFLDKEVVRRVEGSTLNNFLIDFTRCALNPIRGGANILHGKTPWYRASRDARRLYFERHAPPAPESLEKQ